jgi:hypothetical protein
MLSPTRFTPNACPCLPVARVDAVHWTQRAADSVFFLLLPNITVAWFGSGLCVHMVYVNYFVRCFLSVAEENILSEPFRATYKKGRRGSYGLRGPKD